MIKIHSCNLKPIDKNFHDRCKEEILARFYYYKPEKLSRKYIDGVHRKYFRSGIDKDTRQIFTKYLDSVGVTITDESLYLLFMLQKVGEDKLKDSLYRTGLFSRIKDITLHTLVEINQELKTEKFHDILKDHLKLSVFAAQSIIFALTAFIKIWNIIREE